jgi:DHA2 family multidrug resistance protein
MMPIFLALVRGHNALEIGRIMLVTGVAQLIAAPIATVLEKRVDPRLLTGAGFLLFAIGLAMSANQTRLTDYSEMFWPQVVRSAALMMCLLPPTRLALGHLPLERVPDASGLFNLMRNLGGAIGIALVDTVIFGRAPVHAAAIADQLRAGDVEAAKAVGIPIPAFLAGHAAPVTPATETIVRTLVEKLALTQALNEAWLVVAVIEVTALFSLFLIRPVHARNHEAAVLP